MGGASSTSPPDLLNDSQGQCVNESEAGSSSSSQQAMHDVLFSIPSLAPIHQLAREGSYVFEDLTLHQLAATGLLEREAEVALRAHPRQDEAAYPGAAHLFTDG
eukprot:4453334-Pyramimonas_sp.AAC.1